MILDARWATFGIAEADNALMSTETETGYFEIIPSLIFFKTSFTSFLLSVLQYLIIDGTHF